MNRRVRVARQRLFPKPKTLRRICKNTTRRMYRALEREMYAPVIESPAAYRGLQAQLSGAE